MADCRRHVGFFALMEALAQPGCPACRAADRAGRRFIETLLYEQVTDGHIRARLRRSGGFCREHTAIALELGDALGSSLIYADLLAEAEKSGRGGAPERCPACQAGAEAVTRALGTLLQHLSEEDVLAAYEQSDGLCLAHLGHATAREPSAAGRTLAAIERERMRALASQCEEFVAKSDYRHIGEPMGPERNAWRRAAWKLGGGFQRDGAH